LAPRSKVPAVQHRSPNQLLEGPIDYGRDLRTNINALYDLVLSWERPISAKPVDVAAYEAAVYPLYKNAKAEGVLA
jgi:hypothetical protein